MAVEALHTGTVRTGADRLISDAPELIRNKRVGILTNHTGRVSSGRHIVDEVMGSGIAAVTALYGPEHGITGDTPDGEVVNHTSHSRYKIPIYSLYGKIHKPIPEMLDGVDVLLCDIQDVGARFYTFISTVALALESAAENKIPFVLLDRPNPIRGLQCDGPIREQSLRSFVGWMPIPVTYGLTLGELARLWNEEGWLAGGVKAHLEVLSLTGWKRNMWYDETGLRWIAPSPNMQNLATATIYPGMCLIEGTSISEGRGTAFPFELVGAPWANSETVCGHLSSFRPAGMSFGPADFVPQHISGMVSEPKYERMLCHGVRLTVTDRNAVEPVKLGIQVIAAFKRAHPRETELRYRRFDILTGSPHVRYLLDANVHPDEICGEWKPELTQFDMLREKYFLYL